MISTVESEQFRRNDFLFDVGVSGPADGEAVVLLHGFPQRNSSWNALIESLTSRGYRCLAPNQRGYSPRARPSRRWNYRMSELVGDTRALADAFDVDRFHLVGHDWGAAVAWSCAVDMPDRLASLTALSAPHPAAFARSLLTSRQGLASWYMYFFQLPWLPEWVLLRRDAAWARRFLADTGQAPLSTTRDVEALMNPGALTAAMNWYRAMPFAKIDILWAKVSVPTLYVWSDADRALLPKAAHDTDRWVRGDYRFEVLEGASHWLPEERPEAIGELLVEWMTAHPAS